MEIEESGHLTRRNRDFYEQYARFGSAFTFTDDAGNPVVCGGIAVFWKGVGEIWMLKGKRIADHPVSSVRAGRFAVDDAIKRMGLHRIQAAVQESDQKANDYIKAIGFSFEGIMQKYGENKENYLLYARVE